MDFNVDLFKKSFDFLPLGLRINNIGCIRYVARNQWNGQKGSYRGYARFESLEYGVRALTILLMGYIYKYRLFDVFDIILRYAPSHDGNFPNVYADIIRNISGLTKLSNDIRILRLELPLIVYCIACVENGSEFRNRAMNYPEDEFRMYLNSLVIKYFDEYCNQVIYPSTGKVDKL